MVWVVRPLHIDPTCSCSSQRPPAAGNPALPSVNGCAAQSQVGSTPHQDASRMEPEVPGLPWQWRTCLRLSGEIPAPPPSGGFSASTVMVTVEGSDVPRCQPFSPLSQISQGLPQGQPPDTHGCQAHLAECPFRADSELTARGTGSPSISL